MKKVFNKDTVSLIIIILLILSLLSGWGIMKVLLPYHKALAAFTKSLLLATLLTFLVTFIASTAFLLFTSPPVKLNFLEDSWLLIIIISIAGMAISGFLFLTSQEDILLLSKGTIVTGIVTNKQTTTGCGRRNSLPCYHVDYTYQGNYSAEHFGHDLVGKDMYTSLEIGAEIEVRYAVENIIYHRSKINDNFHVDPFAVFIGLNLWPLYMLSVLLFGKKKGYEAIL